ncbi:MAG: hypothetical protein ACHQ2Z_05225 [Elusimicrobiota bacterium]
MKKRIAAAGRDGTPKKGRKGARKCPCCGCAPCACDKSCLCQELKGEIPDEDAEDAGLEDDLRFSFIRYGEQSVW